MACYAAGVLLAAFAALVALPLQAQAQTVWSGTLTVRDLGSSTLGCSNFVATSFCSSRLSDDDFTHDSTDYAIEFIFLRSNGSLEIDFDTDLTTTDTTYSHTGLAARHEQQLHADRGASPGRGLG